jgi:hypothetical protein
MPADRVNHLSMHPLFPFHMNCDHRMRRRHQQQGVENQPEDQANDDQDQIENRGKWLPVQEQPKRRYQRSKDVDHREATMLGLGVASLVRNQTTASPCLRIDPMKVTNKPASSSSAQWPVRGTASLSFSRHRTCLRRFSTEGFLELSGFRKPQERKQLTVVHALTQIDLSSIVFFLGILLAVATLEHTQVLATLAAWLDQTIGRTDVIVLALGLISAIIDNVPLVAASMGMYGIAQFPPDSFSGNSLRTARAQAGRY